MILPSSSSPKYPTFSLNFIRNRKIKDKIEPRIGVVRREIYEKLFHNFKWLTKLWVISYFHDLIPLFTELLALIDQTYYGWSKQSNQPGQDFWTTLFRVYFKAALIMRGPHYLASPSFCLLTEENEDPTRNATEHYSLLYFYRLLCSVTLSWIELHWI